VLARAIRVRPDEVPWFEETMWLDFSACAFAVMALSGPWLGSLEFRAKVFFPAAGGGELDAAVCRATQRRNLSFNLSPAMRYTPENPQ
jgi:hypothetical protein